MSTPLGPPPLRVLVVDDEDLARQRLRALLSQRSDFEIVGECATGADAVKEIRGIRPDLVLLGVQMPELDGFDVISEIGPHNMPAVIFTTVLTTTPSTPLRLVLLTTS